MNQTKLDEGKVKQFNTEIINQFNGYDTIPELTTIYDHDYSNSTSDYLDLKFNFNMKPLSLMATSGSTYYAPTPLGVSRHICQKQLTYLISELKNHNHIIEKKLGLDDFKPDDIFEIIDSQFKPIIISSPIHHKLYNKPSWVKTFHFVNGNRRMLDIPWHQTPKSVSENIILIVDKSLLFWFYSTFKNTFTEKAERIRININESNPMQISVNIISNFLFKNYHDKDVPIYKFILDMK